MTTIKITEEQYKKLQKLKIFLDATLGEEDNSFYFIAAYYDYDGLDIIEGPFTTKSYYTPIDILDNQFLEIIIEDIITSRDNQDEYSNYISYDGGSASGNVQATYNPNNMEIDLVVNYGVYVEDPYNSKFTFDELKVRTTNWGSEYKELKKLGDEDLINKYKEEYGGWIILTYDGSGDSGQINDDYESEKESSTGVNSDIESIAYEALDVNYSGWENNEGSRGEIIIDFDSKTIVVKHIYYGIEDNTEHLRTYKLIV